MKIIACGENASLNYRLSKQSETFPVRANQTTHPRTQAGHSSPELAATVLTTKEAVAKSKQSGGRPEIYDSLETVFRIYVDWKSRKIAKRSARTLADKTNIVRRKGMSPIRVLIEATLPKADFKQKSRWVRALEYVYSQNISVKEFQQFIRRHGGFAGCARLAVQVNRKRKRPRRDCVEGDWDDQ